MTRPHLSSLRVPIGKTAPTIRVLALDTEPETVETLRASGFEVIPGEIGYRTSVPSLDEAPHEFDAIICDLKRPACYDFQDWGPFKGNDNYKFTPSDPTKGAAWFKNAHGDVYPVYRIIEESQLSRRGSSKFNSRDVLRAIDTGGVPAILMLNSEWIRHVFRESPAMMGLMWQFRGTVARKVIIDPTLTELYPLVEAADPLRFPIEYAVQHNPERRIPNTGRREIPPTRPIVSNTVGDTFGILVRVGQGAIWAVPSFPNNGTFLSGALRNLQALRELSALFPETYEPRLPVIEIPITIVPDAPTPTPAANAGPKRELFICHASEDKPDFVRPLVDALKVKGVTVWYDEFEVKMGDRLRRKIEEGLRTSDHGLVVLSPCFFEKDWPQDELAAIANLSERGMKILPIWHRLGKKEVAEYGPLLADIVAAKSSKGIAHVVDEILGVIRPSTS